MKIKKILADSLQEAIELTKTMYGDKATIMSTKVVKTKKWLFFSTNKLEVTIGIADDEDFQSHFNKEKELYTEIEQIKTTLKDVVNVVKNVKQEPPQQMQTPKPQYQSNDDFSLRAMNLATRLINMGVEQDIAKKILEDSCGFDININRLDLKYEDDYESLKEGLSKNISLKTLDFSKSILSILALVGPTGVGKTTTIAKLAYMYKMQGFKTGVITLDSYRTGAVQQLQSYVNLLEMPLRVADTPQKLRECIGELSSLDVIFIDTAGRSQYDSIRLKELKHYLENVPSLEIALTVSTTTDERIILDSAKRFGELGIKSIIFTKLDETVYPGCIINASFKTNLPISFLTFGQKVPNDIEVATYDNIANILLRGTI
jgi:Flagellar GTP-binding protein